MAATISEILQDALQLSVASRIELAERLIEATPVPHELIDEQMHLVRERMARVAAGTSEVIPAGEAHILVRDALRGQ